MVVLIPVAALSAIAAPPSLQVSCISHQHLIVFTTNAPRLYRDMNAFYRECTAGGGTATREVFSNRGKPAR